MEAVGYKVFADIFDLDAGDEWRGKLTAALQTRAIKMLLCCSDETLARRGVREEIAIAEDLTKQLRDPNFIIPLKVRTLRSSSASVACSMSISRAARPRGLRACSNRLKGSRCRRPVGAIQPEWYAYLRRRAVEIEAAPEVLTSNWLRIMGMPDRLNHLVPRNRANDALLCKLGASFEFPMAEFGDGFLTFASPLDLTEHFEQVEPFRVEREFDVLEFMESGSSDAGIESRDAKSIMMNLLRQAWEKHCAREGFLAHTFSSGLSFHVGQNKLSLKKRVSWGRQGERRNSMLRGVARKKIWEYGVSVIPKSFPYPHMRLKGRVLFSDIGERNKPIIIPDTKTQFRLRRSVCSGWRNKAWHGRVMAFMEVLAGDSPYVGLAVVSGGTITLDAMPIQFTAPVTARQINRLGEDAEEFDETTLGTHYEDEDV